MPDSFKTDTATRTSGGELSHGSVQFCADRASGARNLRSAVCFGGRSLKDGATAATVVATPATYRSGRRSRWRGFDSSAASPLHRAIHRGRGLQRCLRARRAAPSFRAGASRMQGLRAPENSVVPWEGFLECRRDALLQSPKHTPEAGTPNRTLMSDGGQIGKGCLWRAKKPSGFLGVVPVFRHPGAQLRRASPTGDNGSEIGEDVRPYR